MAWRTRAAPEGAAADGACALSMEGPAAYAACELWVLSLRQTEWEAAVSDDTSDVDWGEA